MTSINRRDFLQRSILLGSATVLPGLARGQGLGTDYDVVIVGGGIAGLSAAWHLRRLGPELKILILEARDRLGGRIHTVDYRGANESVELGARYVYREEGPLAELLGTLDIIQLPAESVPLNGFAFDGVAEPVSAEAMAAAREALSQVYRTYQGPDLSLRQFARAEAVGAGISGAALDALALPWGTRADQLSARSAIAVAEQRRALRTGEAVLSPSFRSLPERLSRRVSGQVQLGSVVNEMIWRPGIVGIYYRQGFTSSAVTATRAILTLPVGVLKSDAVKFTPGLPDWKRAALDRLVPGGAVSFAQAFPAEVAAKLGAPRVWQSANGEVRFEAQPPLDSGEVLVTGYLRGRAAGDFARIGSAEQGLQWATLVMEEAIGVSGLAGSAKWQQIDDWMNDPHAMGGDAYLTPGNPGAREALAAPVDDTVFFAGEATAEPMHAQSVEGALMSGERAARELAASLTAITGDGA